MARPGIVRHPSSRTICYVCDKQIGEGNPFMWNSEAPDIRTNPRMRHVDCEPGGNDAPKPKPKPRVRKPQPTPTPTDPRILDTLEKVVNSVAEQNRHVSESLGNVTGSIASLSQAVIELQQRKPIQVSFGGLPDPEPIEGSHPVFKEALEILSAGENLYMFGPQGSTKSTIARDICKALKAKMFKLPMGTPAMPRTSIFGFDGPNGYSGSVLSDALTHKGHRVLYIEELDNMAPELQVALHDVLDIAREDRGDNMRLTANHAVDIADPDKLLIVATGNTGGFGATINHQGRRPMDSATRSRFAIAFVGYDTNLELRIAKGIHPEHGERWAKYVHALRPIAERDCPKLVACTRSIQRGAKLLHVGDYSIASRKAAFEVATKAIFGGLDPALAERLHKEAWEAAGGTK